MGSTIRGNRDQRSVRTQHERRETTYGGTLQKTFDRSFTEHSRDHIQPSFYSEPSDTDVKVDHVHELVRDTLAPRIQTKSGNAALTDRRYFLYYPRKRTGRRCGCYLTETSPENQCPICVGTGVVGGFNKFGTITEVLDYTTPNLVMVNVEPNYADDTRPVYLKLVEGKKFGYVEGILPIKNNIGAVDNFMLYQPIFNRGTKIFAIDPSGNQAEIHDRDDLAPFLLNNQVKIRIEFTAIDQRPLISHFIMRYQTKHDMQIWGDIPQSQKEPTTTDFGQFEMYQEISIFFPYRPVLKYNNEDVLYRVFDGRMFRIVLVKENIVANVLTSTDVTARYLITDIDVGVTKHLLI